MDFSIILLLLEEQQERIKVKYQENTRNGCKNHGRWSRQTGGRLIQVKYTGKRFGGNCLWSHVTVSRLIQWVAMAVLTVHVLYDTCF